MSDAGKRSSGLRLRRRAPAVVVVIAFMCGVLADTWLTCSGWLWATVSGGALLIAFLSWILWRCTFANSHRVFGFLTLGALLLSVAGVAAMRHHDVASVARDDDLSLFATDLPHPARLIGTISARPQLIDSVSDETHESWKSSERSIITVACRQLFDGTEWRDVSGSARVDVRGLTTGLRVCDEVEVFGRLSLPTGPKNVGEFDFAAFLRHQGVRSVMRCRSPESMVLRQRPTDLISQMRRFSVATREQCEERLKRDLRSDTVPVAIALLLGSRARMPAEQYEAFTESGTMHVLAISGLNVAILALFVGGVCRLLSVSQWLTGITILLLVGGYAVITDTGPPIVRASLVVFLAALGWPWDRPNHGPNLLAATGLGVLCMNPPDLFNAGAQLSFAAVAVILWQARRSTNQAVMSGTDVRPVSPEMALAVVDKALDELISARMPVTWPRLLWRLCWRAIRETTGMSLWIWVFTAPLVARQFHLVSPVGMLVNIPLLPVASATLCCGYLLMLVGFVSDTLASWLGELFDGLLLLMMWIVEVAAKFSCGHRYVPTPPTWWLLGTFVLLTTLFCFRGSSVARCLGWRWLWVWVLIGMVWPLWPREPGPLRCTTFAVGHGLSVLIETPSGRTLLYDAGSMRGSRRVADIVRGTLWHQGRYRLDGMVLSHADSDHLNGVPDLLRNVPVAEMFVSPQCVDRSQPAVNDVLFAARRCRVPIRFLWESDAIELGDGIVCQVLHPPADLRLRSDNANSVVLAITFGGRRILLTGDLEKDGLARLLRSPAVTTDILVSPHHGSLGANTTDLARWSCPDWLIVSGDSQVNCKKLRERFGPSTLVLNTDDEGSVTFEITASGEMSCETFKRGPRR